MSGRGGWGGRGEAPAPGPIRPWEFPAVRRETLGNGMEARVVGGLNFSVVTAMVVLRAGETSAPAGREGLAALAANALEGGTEARSSVELARALEDMGASFGAATGWDSATVAVSCQAEQLGAALPLLAEMVRRPSFEESEFERFRAQRLATAAHRRMDPGALAADWHARFAYAGGATYGRALVGTEESLGRVRAGDAREFAGARYGPAQAALAIAGDVEVGEALELAEESFGDWRRAAAGPAEADARARGRERTVHVVHRPGAVQSEIRVGHVGVARSVADFLPLTVANLVLGGSFSSRLNLNLRERRGFTYGARSSFAARLGPGPFAVSTAVENAVTGPAVGEIVAEIEKMAESGPTAEEIGAAAGYLAGVFPLRVETCGQIASRIAGMFVFGLPDDHYRTYRDRVRAVTRDEAAEAARRHLRPAELCTVVVGDAEAAAPALEELGVGAVRVHGADGADGGSGGS